MEQNTKKQERRLEMVFLLAVFLTILMWAMVQPFNASPDEAMRYQIVDYIMRHGKLPVGYDAEIRDPNWGFSYAFYPITTYIAGAVFGKIAMLFSSSGMAPIYGARLVNVIFGTIIAGLNLRIGKMLFEKRMAWFYTILICFLPGTIFFNSYVNMDALGLCASSWIVLCWCKAVKNDWSVKLCVELGAAISLCALSYFNAYGYILCSILFFCATILLCGRKKWDVKRMIQLGLVVTAVVIVLAGWWFIRNAILYDGDFIGRKACAECAEKYAAIDYRPSRYPTPEKLKWTWKDILLYQDPGWNHNWLLTVLVSFIGTFGLMQIYMPYGVSKAYFLLFGIGGLGVLSMLGMFYPKKRTVVKERKTSGTEKLKIKTVTVSNKWDRKGIFHLLMILLILIPVGLFMYYVYYSDNQAQGRYIMPALYPAMYFVTAGWNRLLERFVKKENIRMWIYRGLSALLVASPFLCYIFLVVPFYR